MRDRRTIAASVIAAMIATAAAACSAFFGQDTSPQFNGLDAGGAPLEGGAAADGADNSTVDANVPPLDAGPVPSAPVNATPCDGAVPLLFCDDFESPKSNFGFDKYDAPPRTIIEVVWSGDMQTHLLRVIDDTAGLANKKGAPAAYLKAGFMQLLTNAAVLEYDFFLQASALSYSTFGVLEYANSGGNDEVGVGANLGVLGQARDPHKGLATVTMNATGAWHHVKATGAAMGGVSTTTIDGTPVQALDSGIVPSNPGLVFGISECGFKIGAERATVVYYDNIVVR